MGLPFLATNNAVYGEMGQLQLWIRTHNGAMKFWNSSHGEVPVLVQKALAVSKQMKISWASSVRQLLYTYEVTETDMHFKRTP